MRTRIAQALEALVAPEVQLVVCYSSLLHLGAAASGAKWAFLYAIKRLAKRGVTVALPTFTLSFCQTGYFDKAATPFETGVLGQWALVLDGAHRTSHPIYSFALIGPMADRLAAADTATAFGDGSIFDLFEQLDARIVMLGCDWNKCTQFHRYEETAAVPYRQFKEFSGVDGTGGGAAPVKTVMYVRDEAIGGTNDFSAATNALRAGGLIRSVDLLEGRAESAACRDIAETCRRLLDDDPFVFVKNRLQAIYRARQKTAAAREGALRVGLLGLGNLELLKTALGDALADALPGREIDMITPPFGQLFQSVLSPASPLRKYPPAVTVFVDRLEEILMLARLDDPMEKDDVRRKMDAYLDAVEQIANAAAGTVLVANAAQTRQSAHGPVEECGDALVTSRVRIFNEALTKRVDGRRNVHIVDMAALAADSGHPVFDPRLWHVGRFPFGDGFTRHLAGRLAGLVLAGIGKTARLIVVDLDNTLWGGTLGEDGIGGLLVGGNFPGSAYLDFQNTLKRLAARGIALAVSSKNDDADAMQAMARLDEMALRRDDFLAWRVNWNPKHQSIQEIADELSLGLDSVLFIDDNPAERELVRQVLPEVKVLEMPDDPALFSDTLLASPYVACLTVTTEDRQRTETYKTRRAVETHRAQAKDMESFLASLEPILHVHSLDEANVARAAQLCAKTNQFNVTTKRHGAGQLFALDATDGGAVLVLGLEDRFSALEKIGVLITQPSEDVQGGLEIETYLLSCRVLGRGIEQGALAWLAHAAAADGWTSLIGRVIETDRNEPARGVFRQVGFAPAREAGAWRLDLTGGAPAVPDYLRVVDHRCHRGEGAS